MCCLVSPRAVMLATNPMARPVSAEVHHRRGLAIEWETAGRGIRGHAGRILGAKAPSSPLFSSPTILLHNIHRFAPHRSFRTTSTSRINANKVTKIHHDER